MHESLNDLLPFTEVVGNAGNDILKQLGQFTVRQIPEAGSLLDSEQLAGGFRRYLDLSLQIDDRHGLGQAIQGLLSRLLGAAQFRLVTGGEIRGDWRPCR